MAVAVIGDGAFPSGIVFEALNNAGGLEAEPAGHSERQQDVDLPARRRRGRAISIACGRTRSIPG